MKKLMALLMALLILVSAAAADGITRVRYIPAPAGTLSEAAEYVLAASPDGRYMLAGVREMYIRDTAENRNIPLTFPDPEDGAYITSSVTTYLRWKHPIMESLHSAPEEEWEEKLNQILEQFQEVIGAATGGENIFRNLKQVRSTFQMAGIEDPQIEILGVSERYALVMYYYIGLLAVELSTGECRVFRTEDSWKGPVLVGDRVYVMTGEWMAWHMWDLDTNETEEIVLPEERREVFNWNSVAAADADGNLWLFAPDLWMPGTDEEKEAFRLNLLNVGTGDLIKIPFPKAYYDVMNLSYPLMKKVYITGDGRYALVDDNQGHICFVVVNLSDGTYSWNRGINYTRSDDDTTPMMPVAATENGFICYDPAIQQLVYLDPAAMEYTALSFEMRSDDLPGQFREAGMIGIRSGEVWTTITSRMLRMPTGNGRGMIFSLLPGYLAVE